MIPNYEEIMLPFLKHLSDGQEHSLSETHDNLAEHFSLTDEELRELLPSGKQAIFRNRVGWARTYMKKSGLLISPKRTHFLITNRGQELTNKNQTNTKLHTNTTNKNPHTKTPYLTKKKAKK